MPYNQPALTVAIESGALQDRTDASNLTAALGWRDTLANARIAQLALDASEPVIAAQRIDALGRTQGGEFAAPAADEVMAMPDGPKAMAGRAKLRSGGLWWITYLRIPAKTPAAQAGRLAFARELESDDGPWRRTIVGTLMESLQGESAAEARLELWRDTLAGDGEPSSTLYDTDFSRFDTDGPAYGGEWRRPKSAPMAVEMAERGVILSETSPKAGAVLAQRFAAAPGDYLFASRGDASYGRLYWQIVCNGSGPAFTSERPVGEWAVTINANCPVAELRLLAREGTPNAHIDRLFSVSLEAKQ